MNKYGEMARRRWQAMNPESYAQIESPKEFFSTLGDQLSDRVASLQRELSGPDAPDEGYLEKVGRLNAARMQAEEIALDEFLPVETTVDEEETEDAPSEDDLAVWAIHRAGEPETE